MIRKLFYNDDNNFLSFSILIDNLYCTKNMSVRSENSQICIHAIYERLVIAYQKNFQNVRY